MTRALHPCRTCTPDESGSKFAKRRGFTRHADGICAACRRSGPQKPSMSKGRAA